jgi:hypothetical protein
MVAQLISPLISRFVDCALADIDSVINTIAAKLLIKVFIIDPPVLT